MKENIISEINFFKKSGMFAFGVAIGNTIICILYFYFYGAEILGFGTKMFILALTSLFYVFICIIETTERKLELIKYEI